MTTPKKITILASLVTCIAALSMLFPGHIGRFYLGSVVVEATLLAASMLLWMIVRTGRWRTDPYLAFRSNTWQLDLGTFRRNVIVSVIEFICFAGVLELCKVFSPYRAPRFGKFCIDSAALLVVGVCFYLVTVMLVRPIGIRRARQVNLPKSL